VFQRRGTAPPRSCSSSQKPGRQRVIITGSIRSSRPCVPERVKELRVGDRADDRLKQLLALAASAACGQRVPADAARTRDRVAACIRGRRRGLEKATTTPSARSCAARWARRSSSCSTASRIRTTSARPRTADARALTASSSRAGVRRPVTARGESIGGRAGAREIARCHIARASRGVKDGGVWTVGLVRRGAGVVRDHRLHAADRGGPRRRGARLRRPGRERCDRLASIPMPGPFQPERLGRGRDCCCSRPSVREA